MKSKIQSIYFLLPILLIISSCGSNDKNKDPGAANQVQAYPVVVLTAQSTSLETNYPATIEGMQNVDIRPKVDGFIEKIYVDEGAVVKKDQRLFSINAPQYEQLVRTAAAAISSAEADVNAAELQVKKQNH